MEIEIIQQVEKKKRNLKRYKKNLACIQRLEEKLNLLEQKITSVNSSKITGMPRGGVPITTGDLIADQLELQERIERLKEKGRELKRDILSEIDTLDDYRHVEILESFFIDDITLEDIADEQGYTVRHVYRLYSEAVTILATQNQ